MSTSTAAALTQTHWREVDRSFIEHHARGSAPSVVWAIFDETGLAHSDARGLLSDGSVPGPGTAYRIASCTKSFTAAAILALRDEGQLQLDDPITRFLPAFDTVALPSADSPVPTIRMLLTMSAGLPTDDPWADRQESMTAADLDALLAGGLSFESVPGTRFAYSNLGYALLGRVIEQASGTEYREYIAERFLVPLRLSATGFDESVPATQGIAIGARWFDGAWDYLPFSRPGAFSPIGGLFSTLRDLSSWARWLATAFDDAPGEQQTDAVLSRSSRREMQQVQRFTAGLPSHPGGYGYGLFVQHYPDNETVVSHSGGYPGFSAHMRWSTRSRRGIVAYENGTYSRVSVPTTEAFDLAIAGQGAIGSPGVPPASLWTATRAAQRAITDLAHDWNTDAVSALCADNVALDEPLDHRRTTLAAAIATIGGLVQHDGDAGRHEAAQESSVSPAHLIWYLPGAAGRLRIEIQLTPENPPRVQTLKFSPDRVGL